MSIVLNENEWAKEMIDTRQLGKKPFETLRRAARYYLDLGYSTKETRRCLDRFVFQCGESSTAKRWIDRIEGAISSAQKYKAICIDRIVISESEMTVIRSMESVQVQKLAFTLLCLAKYRNEAFPFCDSWVSCRDNEVMQMANIHASVRRQSEYFHTLMEHGIIRPSKKIDNTSIRVLFIEDGEPVMEISDFRNLGYQYLMYCGDTRYFVCQNCGIVTKKNKNAQAEEAQVRGRKQKYCAECAVKVNIQKTMVRVMRNRDADNTDRRSV